MKKKKTPRSVLDQKLRYRIANRAALRKKAVEYYRKIRLDKKRYAAYRAKRREYLRQWRKDNHEHVLADARVRQTRYRRECKERYREKDARKYLRVKNNPDRYSAHLERGRRWRRNNPDAVKRHRRNWAKKHPEKIRANARKHVKIRKQRMSSTIGSHTAHQWIERVLFYGWRCFYCGIGLTQGTLTKDHRIPISRGGTDFASNLVPACRPCNSRKNNQ